MWKNNLIERQESCKTYKLTWLIKHHWSLENCYIKFINIHLVHYTFNPRTFIFSPLQDISSDGKPVLACGDFFQVPPVQGQPVFMFNKSDKDDALNCLMR